MLESVSECCAVLVIVRAVQTGGLRMFESQGEIIKKALLWVVGQQIDVKHSKRQS